MLTMVEAMYIVYDVGFCRDMNQWYKLVLRDKEKGLQLWESKKNIIWW